MQPKFGPWVTNVSETGFNVLWVTEAPMLSFVGISECDGTPYERGDRQRFYETSSGRAVAGTYHNVRVEGLKPGTKYEYRIYARTVQDDSDPYAIDYGPEMIVKHKGKIQTVKTLSTKAESCRFSMVNDMHFKAEKYNKLMSTANTDSLDFIALDGDIISFSQVLDTVVKYTFSPIQDQLLQAPVVFARGNHESRGRDFSKVISLFPTPTGEFYYSFRQGPVAFLVLDGGEDKPDSAPEYSGYAHFDNYRAAEQAWLEKAVKDPQFTSAKYRVVLIHMPMASIPTKNSWHGMKYLMQNYLPILNKANINLMLSGHTHRFYHHPADEAHTFPIVENSNMERLDFSADAKGITIRTYDLGGAKVRDIKF